MDEIIYEIRKQKLFEIKNNTYVRLEDGYIVLFKYLENKWAICSCPHGNQMFWFGELADIASEQDYLDYWRE